MTGVPSAEIGSSPLTAWRKQVRDEVRDGRRLAGLFGTAVPDGIRLTALVADPTEGLRPLDTVLASWQHDYPALTPDLAGAFWYERELHDMFGITPEGHPRLDPLVLPLAESADRPRPGASTGPGALHPIEEAIGRHVLGPGMFTIPHGPVRSGVFESVEYLVETPGEDIPFPQIRVYHKHRGIEKRFEGLTVADGALLAERTEGIASVAHALAYCHAIEDLTGAEVSRAAGLVRVLHAELERVANHLDVVLRLVDAAGLAVAVARFGWHKERVLRLVSRCCGNRFGRGVVVPGGVRALPRPAAAELLDELKRLGKAITDDERILMTTSSFLDRLRGTGPLTGELARTHGALGPIGRASGRTEDVREVDRYDGYRHVEGITPPRADVGDAMARLRVRWAEIHDAFELADAAVTALDSGSAELAAPQVSAVDGRGIGRAEAPQGEVVYVVEVAAGRITRGKPRSASFHNLPLFHSVFAGDILTDFPFIEASFGLSIAGVVL
ncbi:MAG TPA: NADH-quinone oxidoreductase subunit C [Pseudonocardiaceae bacterium]|jgi:Ni,Fe-hydrogenase III large subunit|nr:NADH-quinone oxidoreductase subunit C [Pseudonocardiaceae bacterium]